MHVEKKQHAFVYKQQYIVANALHCGKWSKKIFDIKFGFAEKQPLCQFEFYIFILNTQ